MGKPETREKHETRVQSNGDDASKKQKDDKPVKIDKWDGSALKNSLDDAAKKVLKDKLGFLESHNLMDGRLALCTISVAFAAFALVWDYFYPFPKSSSVLIICVLSYFFMMVVLTLYTMYFERGCFMVGIELKTGPYPNNVWKLASRLKRYDETYELFMSCTDGATGKPREESLCKSVCCFFDENGYLCEDIYEAEVLKLQSSLSMEKKDN